MQPEQNILVSCRYTKYYTIKMMVRLHHILNMQILLQFRDFYFPLPTPFFRWKLTTVCRQYSTLLQQTSLRFAIVLWCWSLILLWCGETRNFGSKGWKTWVISAKGGCSTRGPIPNAPLRGHIWGVQFEFTTNFSKWCSSEEAHYAK